MSAPFRPATCLALVCGALSLYSHSVLAADAGSILRDQPKAAPVQPAPAAKAKPAEEAVAPADAGPKVLVKGFAIEGAERISADEIISVLSPLKDRELSFNEIKFVRGLVSSYYAQKGLVARVILPPQEIKDGIIRLRVVEGRLGQLDVTAKDQRANTALARSVVQRYMGEPGELNLIRLGEGVSILDEQPGVSAKSSLLPGKAEQEVNVNVLVENDPTLQGSVQANNHGSKGTGVPQLQASLQVNNPADRFDVATFTANANEGSLYGRADYSAMVHSSGWRLGAGASALRYKVVEDSLSALDSRGTATTVGLNSRYPLFNRSGQSLNLLANFDVRKLVDKTSSGETGNRDVKVLTLGVAGKLEPGSALWLAGAGLAYTLDLSSVDSQQNNASALSTDSTTRKVNGKAGKLAYTVDYNRPLAAAWTLATSLRGQFASANLDSSEGFGLGGPNGVRAYPAGEANGDEGWLLSLNARRAVTDQLGVTGFVDAGGVRLNHTTWTNWNSSNTALKNTYQLYGVGAAVDWRFYQAAVLNAAVGLPVGTNPGRSSSNRNADGRENGAHLWVSINAAF